MRRKKTFDWIRERIGPGKHTTYYELLDALAEEGCAVCRLSSRGAERYLKALLYEGVNDVQGREGLRRSRGFCNRHAWYALDEMRDVLGVAIIYRDVVNTLLGILGPSDRPPAEEKPSWPSRFRPRRLMGRVARSVDATVRLAPGTECPACRGLRSAGNRYLDVLLAHHGDGDVRSRYRASGGLCWPHLAGALARSPGPGAVALLLDVAEETLARVRRDVAGDQVARERAVAMLAGGPGLARWPVNPAEPEAVESRPEGAVPPAVERLAAAEAGAGCRVCRAGAMGPAAEGYVRALVSRSAAEAERAAAALCGRHARLVAREASPEWVATLLGSAAVSGQKRLRAAREESDRRGRATVAEPVDCPVCRIEGRAERALAAAATERIAHAGNGSLAEEYLCLRHLVFALRASSDPREAGSLRAAQAIGYARVLAEVDEFTRKHDYRFARDSLGTAADAPRRAVALVAGEPGGRGPALD